MFKLNNKDTRTYFTPCFSVFIVDFEQVNAAGKVRPFNSAKVRCMHDHAKPTLGDFKPDHIILHCGTNYSNFDRTFSQIAREIIGCAL